jgi:serine/threonine protein phosphatase PrpC
MPDSQAAQDQAQPEPATTLIAEHVQPDLGAAALPTPAEPAAAAGTHGWDLPTAAPTVGAVRRQPVPSLAPATRFRAPAVTLDAVQAGAVHVAAASVIGASHTAAGGVRQDAYDFTTTGDGYLVIAVADGLGSRPLSQLGAAFFCTGVTQAAIGQGSSAARAAEELLCRGAEYAAAAQDFCQVPSAESAFVAAVAVLPPAGTGGIRTADIARVGDVSAFAIDPDGLLAELFTSHDGPINILGESLPGSAVSRPQRAHSQARVLILATDGLANDLRNSPGVRSWLSEQWTRPIGPFAFGDSLRYQRQGSHDDRTAIVVWQTATDPGEAEEASDECA